MPVASQRKAGVSETATWYLPLIELWALSDAEPTSGLDSFTANEVMQVVSSLARDGTTIATTIHSPSSYCFGLFNKLLILISGRLVYFGDTGSVALSYFTGSCGARQPQVGDNLAEWMLEVVTQADRNDVKATLAQVYRKSPLAQVGAMAAIVSTLHCQVHSTMALNTCI